MRPNRKFKLPTRISVYLLLLVLALSTSSCLTLNDPETFQDYRSDDVATIKPGQSVGQTFKSRRSRLNGIQVWLRLKGQAAKDQKGTLVAEVYHSPSDSQPIYSTMISFRAIAANNQVTIPIPPQNTPPWQDYYLVLKTQDGEIQTQGRNEDAYPHGQVWVNDSPIDADLALRLSYDYNINTWFEDLNSFFNSIWLIVPFLFVLWIPGWWLLELSGLKTRFDLGEKLALITGLSLAIIPIMMTWTSLIGLRWGQVSSWILFLGLFLGMVWRSLRNYQKSINNSLNSPQQTTGLEAQETENNQKSHPVTGWKMVFSKFQLSAFNLALISVFIFSLAIRLIMVRDLAASPWVDSVHHAMITQLILDQGRLPSNFSPYINVNAANYHTGLHAGLAFFEWLSGLELTRGLLLYGQILNALAVLAVYLFATTFTRNRIAGLFAALITGVFTPMPAYYTSWGRYPQLASIIIMSSAIALIQVLLDKVDQEDKGVKTLPALLLAAVACSGVYLTHFRAAAFLACLLAAMILVKVVIAAWKKNFKKTVLLALGMSFAVAFTAILLTLPDWPGTISTLILPKLNWTQGTARLFEDFVWGYLNSGLGTYTLALAGLGALWALIQKKSFPIVFGLWILFMFILANLKVLHLPGGGFINNSSVEISLFIPISVLAGYLIAWVIQGWHSILAERWRLLYTASMVLLFIGLAFYGARKLIPILNPITMLFREDDRPAMEWIEKNIPEQETILINPFLWGYGIYAGNDGGFWIIPLAKRKTLPPPVIAGLGTQSAKKTSEISRQVTEDSKDPQALHGLLESIGIHTIYIGARGGSLSPKLLNESPLFRSIYNYRDTWVFEVLSQP